MSNAITLVSLARPSTTGEESKSIHSLCEVILDHWRSFTDVQIGIAATLLSCARPAEVISRKQQYRLEQALDIARDLGVAE